MLIEYKMMHKVMMDMVTGVVHLVEEILEVVAVAVCLEEDVDRLFVTIVISQDMWQESVRTQLRHDDIAEQ